MGASLASYFRRAPKKAQGACCTLVVKEVAVNNKEVNAGSIEIAVDYAGLFRLGMAKINLVEGRGVEPPTPTLRT
jgi:hypothetical protein